MKPNDVTKSDHEFVWLEPLAHEHRAEEGRVWCHEDVWSSDCIGEECGGPTKYVRSDLYDAALLKLGSCIETLEEVHRAIPTTWLDPLLSGPNAVKVNNEGNGVEKLLTALRDRITQIVTPTLNENGVHWDPETGDWHER